MFRERSSPHTMKVISLSEAKAHLSKYARLCHGEPVIVTVNGRPGFQLVPLNEDDDLIDSLLEHCPQFRKELQSRLKGKTVTAKEALRSL